MKEAFSLTTNGNWPAETYTMSLCSSPTGSGKIIDPNLSFVPAENLIRYQQKPAHDTGPLNTFSYVNAITASSADGSLDGLDVNANATATWALSSHRVNYNLGPQFNYSWINVNPGVDNGYRKFYGYLLYPNKLSLLPTKLVKNASSWSLTTSAVLASPSAIYLDTTSPDATAYAYHKQYLTSAPVYTPILNSPSTTLVFSLSAFRNRADMSIIQFGDPNGFSRQTASAFDKYTGFIRPDSTFFTYNTNFIDNNKYPINLFQAMPDERTSLDEFHSQYNFDQSKISNYQQVFELLKYDFTNTNNPVAQVSAVVSLSSSNVSYFSVSAVQGAVNSKLGFSFDYDSYNLYTGETLPSAFVGLSSINLSSTLSAASLNGTLACSALNGWSQVWETKYPPHYYSYKASARSNALGLTKDCDTHNLNFRVRLSSVNLSASAVMVSAVMTSDQFGYTYSLEGNSVSGGEYIKYEVTQPNTVLNYGAIKAYYGLSRTSYSWTQAPDGSYHGPWIPVSGGCLLNIEYPDTPYGATSLCIRPTLSSAAGFQTSKFVQWINLDSVESFSPGGQPIFIDYLSNGIGSMDVTASMLVAAPQWPTRDLRGTKVSWDFLPANLPVSMSIIDSSGEAVKSISPGQSFIFTPENASVRFSGYGLSTLTARLSSQEYNEMATLTSVASGFDPLAARKFSMGINGPVLNTPRTRTVSLTARVPYVGSEYNLPINTPVAWEWKYNYNKNPDTMPIKAYVGPDKTPYVFGTTGLSQTLSALTLEVTPDFSHLLPDVNSVKAYLICNTKNSPIVSNYEFFLDGYPDRISLNSDFTVKYTGFSSTSAILLDTRKDQYVSTRPNNNTNNFTLSRFDNNGISSHKTFVWSVSDNVYGQHSLISAASSLEQTFNITDPAITTTTISLCALSAIANGWNSVNITSNDNFKVDPLHNTATSVTLYTPSTSDFYKALKFNVYPEVSWIDSPSLTIIDQNTFTLSSAPTAYQHLKNGTVRFAVSANKEFREYDYSIGTETAFLSTVFVPQSLLEIPFSKSDSFFTQITGTSGLSISLTAFNDLHPSVNTLAYVIPVGGNLTTEYFQTTATTNPFASNPFEHSPKLLPYVFDANLSFSIVNSAIDLDYVRTITLDQTISPVDSTSPVIWLSSGKITYLVSADNWYSHVEVPAINGTFDAINLTVGDPFEEGYVSGEITNHITIKPITMTLNHGISSSTFNNYDTIQYPGERDLWASASSTISVSSVAAQSLVAYSTGAPVEAYLSSYITQIGTNVTIEYSKPSELDGKDILFFKTNFGEVEDFTISLKDKPAIYSYSSAGSFYVTYEAHYLDGSIKYGSLPSPIVVKQVWSNYNQEQIRTVNEEVLSLPYSIDEIEIQPNEYGVADIFNTAITRLYDSLEYLEDKMQTINTDTPTVYFGWMGCHPDRKSEGIRWFTSDFGGSLYKKINDATSSGKSFFNNISDVIETSDYIFVLDGKNIRTFYNKRSSPEEIIFSNIETILSDFIMPTGIAVDDSESVLYVSDSVRNRIYALELDFANNVLNSTATIGAFGSKNDPNRFNAPSQILAAENSVFVLDFNNRCVKEFTKDLNWVHTYYSDDFLNDSPIAITSAHSGVVYILTTNSKVYAFYDTDVNPIAIFDLKEIGWFFEGLGESIQNVSNISFDEAGEFFYVTTATRIFKYTSAGYYIGAVDSNFPITSINKSINRHLLVSTGNAIAKIQDVVSLFKIGDGLPKKKWSLDQLLIKDVNFGADLDYNKSLRRFNENIISLRNTFNGKFVKVTEHTSNGIITYFALVPISVDQRPVFSTDIESYNISVAVNEFHLPSVFNREFNKLYSAILQIKNFLNISSINLPDLKIEGSFNFESNTVAGVSVACSEPFCWSWRAMADYRLTLPAIRICNVNPINYTELKKDFPVQYAPSKTWKEATSDCCNKTPNPLT